MTLKKTRKDLLNHIIALTFEFENSTSLALFLYEYLSRFLTQRIKAFIENGFPILLSLMRRPLQYHYKLQHSVNQMICFIFKLNKNMIVVLSIDGRIHNLFYFVHCHSQRHSICIQKNCLFLMSIFRFFKLNLKYHRVFS